MRWTISPAIERIAPLSFFADAMTFLVGVGTQFVVHVVGDLPVAEVFVVFFSVPMVIIYRKRALRRDFLWVYCLLGLWLINQVATDLYRHTAQLDWIRGDAMILFFGLDIAFACMVLGRNNRRKLIYITGLVAGALMAPRMQPTEMALENPWKFGYAMGVNLCVVFICAFLCSRRKYLVAMLMVGGDCALNLFLNYRSPLLALLVMAALTIPVIPEQIGPWRVLPPRGSRAYLVTLITLALLTSIAAGAVVKAVSQSDLLEEKDREKNLSQAGVRGGLLIGGRPEILVSSVAVADSPILGHGSWARDYKYIELLNDVMYERGMEDQEGLEELEEDSGGLIPTHSHLMGAWVTAGILGAVFWVYIWVMLGKGVVRLATARPAFAQIYAYLILASMWDILFSPFGTGRRMLEAFVIVVVFDVVEKFNTATKANQTSIMRGWRRGSLQPRVPMRGPLPAGGTTAGD